MEHWTVIANGLQLNAEKEITYFDSIRTFGSKWPREIGETITFEGKKYTVVGTSSSKEGATNQKDTVLAAFKTAGFRFTRTTAKF